MKLQEQGGDRLQPFEPGISDAGLHLDCVEQFDPGNRDTHLQHGDDGIDGTSKAAELADARSDLFGDAEQAELELGDHAQRALTADIEAGEVVAGRRFARASAGSDNVTARRHHGEPQRDLPHRAIAHRIGATRAGRGHTTKRRIGARIERKEQSLISDMGIERLARHTCLHAAIEVGRTDLQHRVHAAKVDADPALDRLQLPFERSACPEWDHRYASARTAAQYRGDFLRASGENNGVGRPDLMHGLAAAVRIARGLGGGETIAEVRPKLRYHSLNRRLPLGCGGHSPVISAGLATSY